jgi:hypothetical protein
MLGVCFRLPGFEIAQALRQGADHFKQHDGFGEVIEIIGG